MNLPLDDRPVVVAIAGPNGAGKTTFYHVHLKQAGLRFVNADVIAGELGLDVQLASLVAAAVRRQLLELRESFVFETVFSDPVGDKLRFLQEAAASAYTTLLCFIGLGSARVSEQRVAMRVSQGGHDVPAVKLTERYPRIMTNLRNAIATLPHVWVFDNDDLRTPFHLLAVFASGKLVQARRPWPSWFKRVVQA